MRDSIVLRVLLRAVLLVAHPMKLEVHLTGFTRHRFGLRGCPVQLLLYKFKTLGQTV
jgi:hypothetical protein